MSERFKFGVVLAAALTFSIGYARFNEMALHAGWRSVILVEVIFGEGIYLAEP